MTTDCYSLLSSPVCTVGFTYLVLHDDANEVSQI